MKKIFLLMTLLLLFCCNISAQTHLTFMGIPITGTREAMMAKLKAKGFTEKTQENEVGVELKEKYLGKDVWLRIYNSNKSKTVYLIDIFFKKVNSWICMNNILIVVKSLMAYMVNQQKSSMNLLKQL